MASRIDHPAFSDVAVDLDQYREWCESAVTALECRILFELADNATHPTDADAMLAILRECGIPNQ